MVLRNYADLAVATLVNTPLAQSIISDYVFPVYGEDLLCRKI